MNPLVVERLGIFLRTILTCRMVRMLIFTCLLLFGLMNLAVGMTAAGFFGIGPLKRARLVGFFSDPALHPPMWFNQVVRCCSNLRMWPRRSAAAEIAEVAPPLDA